MSVTIPRKGNRGIFVGIYRITSPTGRVYIGQSWDILGRWSAYRSKRCSDQPALFNSLRKHGPDNHQFEILVWFSAGCNQEFLDRHEREQIAIHRSSGISLLNIMEGGRNGRHSEQSKARIGAANRGNKRPDLAEYNRKVKSVLMRGSKLSEETKRKIGAAHKGRIPKCKGRIQSAEERQKRSEITRLWWARRKQESAD